MEYDYNSSSTPVELTPGQEAKDLSSLAEYVNAALRLIPSPGWELVSHDVYADGGQPILTLIFRRPSEE